MLERVAGVKPGLFKRVGLVYVAVLPLLLFLVLETINPAASSTLESLRGIGVFVMSALLIAFFVFLVFCLSGSVFWSYAAVSSAGAVIYVVNYVKIMITGRAFVPGDIFVFTDALSLSDYTNISPSPQVLFSLFVLAALHVPLWFISGEIKLNVRRRFALLPATAVVMYVVFFGSHTSRVILPAFGVQFENIGSVSALYRDQGVLLGFRSVFIEQTRARVAANNEASDIARSFFYYEHQAESPACTAQPGLAEGVRPNVIVIMSEAFMDPTVLDNITFSQDPVSNLRRLSQTHQSGNVVVPVYGGGTCNTEFEFLTGNAIFFTGSAYAMPFMQPERFFFRPIRTALPWLFRDNGYRTVGVHPYFGDFFMRNHHYPLLGFDSFYSIEDMPYAPLKGNFVSDEYFTDRIIEQIKLAEADGVPLFLFGISMQNHWGFDPYKYQDYTLDVLAESELLTEEEIGIVNSFVQGVFDADKQLGRLIGFIEEQDTPTLVVFFGDHLPILGEHSDAIFERLGYITNQQVFNWTDEDRRRMFQTPYLIWANYELEPTEEYDVISTFFLGALTARFAGIELNNFYEHILYSLTRFRALTENHYVDINGVFHNLYGVRELPHIRAFGALQDSNLFGSDEFHRSLRQPNSKQR